MISGVPQASVLKPRLLCIFIYDLPLYISDSKVSEVLFADDSSLHASRKNTQSVEWPLLGGINEVSDWRDTKSVILHPAQTNKNMVIVKTAMASAKSLSAPVYS